MPEVFDAKPLRAYVLEITFENGLCAQIDVADQLYGDVFEPLRDPSYFMLGAYDEEAGTIVWPSGADFSPEFLSEAAMAATE